MNRSWSHLDAEIFARTASIFSAKRATFPAEAIEAVATEIVRRLADFPRRIAEFDVPQISNESLASFCDALVLADPSVALRFIEDPGERWDRETCPSSKSPAERATSMRLCELSDSKVPWNNASSTIAGLHSLQRFRAKSTALASPLPQTSFGRQVGRLTSKLGQNIRISSLMSI